MGWCKIEEFKIISYTINNILKDYNIKCLCDKILEPEELTFRKEGLEYWLFCHCKKCGYDYNHEKIFRQFENLGDKIKKLSYEKDTYSF